MVRFFAFFSFIFSFFIFLSFSASVITTQNYTTTQVKTIINQSIAYINNINESGFLFFNPNLTKAYLYLNESFSSYNTSPNLAVAYAELAESSASNSLAVINNYRAYALVGSTAFTLIFGLWLYIIIFKNDVKKRSRGKINDR